MYFNRKNAEQKNWRMIKKGKHFLFGCSLVFAVGASLATQTVHADTASESTVESGSKAKEAKPGYGGETGTYEAPAAVAETQPATVEKAVVAENTTAKTANKEVLTQLVEEVKGLDKAGKTEDSLSRLNTALEQAQKVLDKAEASQDQVDTAVASLKEAVAQLAAKEEKATAVATEAKVEEVTEAATEPVAPAEPVRSRGKRDLSSRAAYRSVDGSVAEGEFAGAGVKQFQSVRYSVDGDTTTWTISVVPQHKNHQAAGLVVASDDTIQSITVVDRGPNAGRLNEDYYVEKDFGKLPAMSNHKALASHYKYVGGGVPDSLTYRVVTKGTHHNLFARFATAIVKNSLENGGMNGSSAVKNRTSDFPEVGVNISSRLAPQPGVNNTYTQTNDTITVPTVASTDTTISGTGKPGAIINLKSKGQTAKQTQVAANGQWSFPLDFGLNSSVSGGPQLVTGDDISVTQTVGGVESAATPVNISLGHSEIVPSSKSKQQNNLVANDRNVTLKVPHDAGAAYFQFTDTDGKAQEVGLKRTAVPGKWQVNSSSSAIASVASSEDGKFYSTINLTLNKDMKAGTTARVISNMQEGSYSSLQGWQSRNVEEAPKAETPKEETPAPVAPQPEPSKPTAPAVDGATTAPASAPEIVNDLAGKASTPADVTVKAPAGSTVKLYNKDGVVIGEAVANDKGVATVRPTNSLPEGEITATSTPAGGKESAKSAPITVTKTPLTEGKVSQQSNGSLVLIVSKNLVTVYPGDKIDIDVWADGTPSLEKFDAYQNPTGVAGVFPQGHFFATAGSNTWRNKKNKYIGTVAETQKAGTVDVGFVARNKKGNQFTDVIRVVVLETAKKYEPVAGTKVDVADPNKVSEDEKTKIIDSVKTANPSLPANATYSVDEKGNLTITYPDKSTDKVAAAYLVNPAKDTTAPDKPVVNTDLTGKAGTKTPVEVTAEKGSTVALYDKDNNKIGEATAGENGKATITPKVDIPAGPVTAKATDAAGNESKPSDAKVATDTTAPAKPVVNTDLTGKAGTKTPVEVTAEKGSTVALYDKNNNKIGEATAGANGKATITPKVDIPAGNVTAKATDAAGNTSVASDPKVATPARENVAPTVEIPYSDPAPNKKEVYLYTGEDADVDITFNDDSGKIKSASLKKGGNIALNNIDGNPEKQDNEFGYTVTAINSETATPAKIKVTGRVSGLDDRLPKTENDSLELVTRFATATDTDGALINNTAVKTKKNGEVVGSYLTDPGAVTFVLKAQTKKYDIKTPASADKVTVSDANNVTDKEFEKIKEKVKVEYSQNNPDARLADKKGQEVEDASKVVDKVEKDGNKVVVTYKDGSKDTKPLSEFVNVAPTVEIPYSNQAKKEIYVYTGENTDLTFKASDNTAVKDMYVRGPGGIGKDNTADYGFTTGKIENSAVTHGDGTVSGATATIKMTGVTTLTAPNHWTSFVVANDNDNAPSNTDFNALDKNPNATQTPGYVHFIVKSQTDKYDIATPAPADKVEVADPTKVTDAELDKIKEKLKLEYNKKNDDANIAKDTPVNKNGKIQSVTKDGNNLVVTYTDGSKDTKPLTEFVTKKPTDADKNEPKAKDQTVKVGEEPKAEDSIENFKGLPEGTTAKFKEPVDTKTPGDKSPVVVVTYPDGSTEEVPVKVTVEKPSSEPTDADKNEPKAKDQTVKVGEEPKAEDSIENFKGLPEGTTAKFKEPVDTKTPGDKSPVVVVTYPDGSTEEVPVKVTVEKPSSEPTDADKNEPKAKDQTVKVGEEPKAEDSIENFKGLPEGTTAKFKEPVDTKTPGDKSPVVVVTYPDGSKEEVPVKVTVEKPSSEPTDADKNEPKAKDQTVKVGEKPKAEDSIENFKGLPEGTTAKFKEPVDTKTPGDKSPVVVVTYPDGSTEEVPVKVTVEKPSSEPTDADKNEPKAKDQTVKVGEEPKAEDSIENFKGLPEGTTAKFKEPVDTKTPGDKSPVVVVTYPDGSTEEVPVKVTVEKPSSEPTDADKNEPKAKDQTVKVGEEPKAEDSIENFKGLPEGTTAKFKEPVDTKTPGDKSPVVVVTYPDGSTEEVPVKVTVEKPSSEPTDADKNEPKAKDQTVKVGEKPKAEDSIENFKGLPEGTTAKFKEPVDTKTPGDKSPVVVVTYPDGSTEEVPVKVTVEKPSSEPTDADKNEPKAKDQTVKVGEEPKAEDSIENFKGLPEGTTAKFKEPVDTKTPGDKTPTVVVTYPDGSTEEVPVKVTVEKPSSEPTDADKNEPKAKDQTVKVGEEPKAEDSIENFKGLPEGTTAKFKEPVDTKTPGDKTPTVVVTYPDGSTEEVPVKVTVEKPSSEPTDADKNEPKAKDQTVKVGEEPKAEDSIENFKGLPEGTTAKFKEPVDTKTPGDKSPVVVVTYPDGSTEEVPVKVTVEKPSSEPTDADKNEPKAKDQTVKVGEEPKAEDSIENFKGLPEGTTAKFKEPVDTKTPGDKTPTVVVTYPDGSTEEVPVKVTVEKPSSPEDPSTKDTDGDGLTDKEEAEKGTDPKKADTDGDGLTDKEEVDKGTDPKKADTDGDGLTDKEEAEKGTDPKKADTDGDGFTDKEEVDKGTDPKDPNSKPESKPEDPSTKDTDGDGLTDKEEAEKGTDPKKADTDGDGFTDKEEVDKGTDPKDPNSKPESKPEDPSTKDTDGDGLTDKEEAEKGTDPKKADTDGDGLTDKEEVDKGTDPKKADTDGDGLTDKEEVDKGTDPKKADTDGDGLTDKEEAEKGTDPKKADTDGDGFTDKEEVDKGTDPKDPNSKPESKPEDPSTKDTDGDGLTDKEEAEKGTDPKKADTDGDGLTDKEEVDKGTDPKKADTDGDGLTDKEEVDKGTDPKKADTDGDGLTDKEEAEKGTDPKKADTDGDGFTDKEEVDKGTDPKDPNSKPESKPEDPSTKDTDADKNTPVAKDQTVKPGDKPSAKDSIGNVGDLPKGTTVEFKTPVDTTTPGDKTPTVVVTYPDGSKDEVPVKVTVKDPSAPATDADKNTPTPKDQTVKPGDKPSAKDSIGNVGDLPKGTTVEFKTPVDTTTPGDKTPTVVVTYPDGSKDEVPVKVTVKDPSAPATDADKNTPTPKDQTVKPGDKPSAKDSIGNVGDLPKGTTVEFKTPVDTTTPGDKTPTVVVTYPDGSKDEIPVKVTVKDPSAPATDADKNTPTPKDQTVKPGDKPSAKDSIGNVGDLPKGTTVEFKTPVDTTTPGDKTPTVVVTYPDGSKDEIPVKVTVKDPSAPATDADKNTPTPKDQTVKPGDKPSAKDSIGNVGDLPKGTTVEFKTPVDTTTPGDKTPTVVVTYPDGSKDEVPVKVTVKDPSAPATDADKNTPTAKDQTVKPGDKPSAKDSIGNVGDLPKGTTVEFKTPVDTTTPGDKGTTVVVTYPDGSKDEVPVKVTVKDPSAPATDADKNTPTAKDQTVKPGDKPSAKDSIGNVGDLPKGTTVEFKTPVDTTTPGDKGTTVVVTYPDGSKDEVPVKVTVKDPSAPATDADKNTPVAKDQTVKPGDKPSAKDSIGNVGDLPKGTTVEFKTPVDTTTPGDKGTIVVVTYPDGSKDEVPVKVTVKDPSAPATDADKNTPTAKDQTVKPGDKPSAKDSIGNVGDLPKGTTVEFKTPVDTTTPGDKGTTVVVTYPDGSKDEVPVKVTVKDPSAPATDADKNTPTAKDQTVKPGDKPSAKDSIGNVGDLPKGTTVEFKTPVDTTTPGDKGTTVVVTYPDGSKDEVPVKVTVKDPSAPATDADKNTPVAKDQTVKPGDKPSAKDSIGNVGDLPKGTTVEFKTPVDTTTPGDKGTTVVVTYPDGSKDEVPVKVTVKDPSAPATDADKNTPTAKDQTVKPGEKPKAEDSIDNLKDLPKGTTVEFKTPVDTTTPGDKGTTVVVTYPDGSKDEVPVKVTVKDPEKTSDADNNTPTAKDQTVKPGDKPSAKDSIGNVGDLPEGTTVEFKTPVDTTTPGDKDATVVVTYPDGSKDEVPVKVTVKDPEKTSDADKNTPTAKDQTVKPGDKPSAKDSIGNVGDLPEGTTVEFKTPVDTTTPGDKDATVVVTYPDGSKDEVPVKVTVKDPSAPATDADKNTPTAKDQTVKPGDKPSAKDSIGNVGDLPKGTTVEFKTPVDTTTPGDKGTTVVVTYPDGSKDEVPVKVTVKDPSAPATDADKNTPTAKDQTVKPGDKPSAKDSIGNVGDLPKGTTVEFKTPVDTTTPGDKGTTVVVTYPDGSKDEVPVKVTVKDPTNKVVKDPSVTPVTDPSNLTDAEKAKVADEVKKANPTAKDIKVNNDGSVVVTFEDGTTAVIPADKTVKKSSDKVKESDGVKNPSVTPVTDPSNLTDAEKAKVADEVKKANPTAKDIKVNNDGSVVVTFEDGSVAVIPAEKAVTAANQDSPAQAPAKKAGAKELPNTGTEQSSASLALALLAAATGGLLFAKKREEEE